MAVIGGGRWARVLAGVLEGVLSPDLPLTVCSPGNPCAWTKHRAARGRAIRIAGYADLLADPSISHVIVARRARDHARTALDCLHAGKAVLVEKPFALTRQDCDSVVAAARDGTCRTGLVFLFAPNLRAFSAACLAAGTPTRIDIDWADPAVETRHGERKGHDRALNVVQDVLPHVWSLFRMLVPDGAARVASVDVAGGGRVVTLDIDVAGLHGTAGARVSARMARVALARKRRLQVSGPGLDGGIDFSVEPGVAHVNGRDIDIASGFGSPLARQLRAFLDGHAGDDVHDLAGVARAVEAIDLTLDALPSIRAGQRRAIAAGRHAAATPSDRAGHDFAMAEIVRAAIDLAGDMDHEAIARAAWPEGEGRLDATDRELFADLVAAFHRERGNS
ncbi:MAG: Gfo/Idh/MocA family oxidoreductase [Pseudomonadota bacterium]|nr:Gfo/Idh/MocA family oxidoreductase [Pseudomonadota bacterium]